MGRVAILVFVMVLCAGCGDVPTIAVDRSAPQDVDGDGIRAEDGDCDDFDGEVDNSASLFTDDDGDGFSEFDGDCDDSTPDLGPKALEIQMEDGAPQGIDDDCDGLVDELPVPCPGERSLAEPTSFAYAMDVCGQLLSASWTSGVAIDARSRNIVSKFGDTYVPHSGADMVVLSTGIAVDRYGPYFDDASTDLANSTVHPSPQSDPGDECGQADPATVNDYTELRLVLEVPTNVKNLSFDLNFMSIEFPEFVCSAFDDTFLAMLDSASFQGNVAFDSQGSRVSINVGYFDVCALSYGAPCKGQDELVGTGFETNDLDDGGGTGWLTATTPVTPGEHITLTFMLFDEGDHVLDSLVLLDNFRWGFTEVPAPIMLPTGP